MNLKTLGRGLGLFSIALGMSEVLGGKRIARGLGQRRDRSRIVQGFGAREIATGALLLARPTSALGPALRAGGDVLDLAALGAASRSPNAKRRSVTGAALFVAGALVADVLATRAMRAA